MISKIYSLPISNSIIFLLDPFPPTCIDPTRNTIRTFPRYFLNIATATGRKKEGYSWVVNRFQYREQAGGGFRKMEKSLEAAWTRKCHATVGRNADVRRTRDGEMWEWEWADPPSPFRSWKKSRRELAFETFSSLRRDTLLDKAITIYFLCFVSWNGTHCFVDLYDYASREEFFLI